MTRNDGGPANEIEKVIEGGLFNPVDKLYLRCQLRRLARRAFKANRVYDGKGEHWPEEANRHFENLFGIKP